MAYDTTNFYTWTASTNGRNTLAPRGHNKQSSHNLRQGRQVGLSYLLDGENGLSLCHHVYAGNITDAEEFPVALKRIVALLDQHQIARDAVTLVVDKGSAALANTLELKQAGIIPHHDLPGVGKNLQDHVQARFTFLTRMPGTLNEILTSTRQQALMALEWLRSASGQLAVGATEGTLFARSSPSEPVPDLQFQCTNFSTEHLTLGLDRWPGFGFNFCVCRPKSRGEIKLADGTGRSKPLIFANYFSDDDDMRRSVAAFHIGRQIIATEPYRSLIFCEVRPGAHVVEEAQIMDFIRQVAGTVFHPCGTCRMGEDDEAVVDSDLRVRGLEGLRVADASVMPVIPSPNIHPATIMIAEKGSDAIAKSLAN